MIRLPNTMDFDHVWISEQNTTEVCHRCGCHQFGKKYRLWNKPILSGTRVIWNKTNILVCNKCKRYLLIR